LEAARAQDRIFHNRIARASGFTRSWQAQQQLRAMSDRYIAIFMSDQHRAKTSMEEHFGILEALRRHDPETSASLATAHVHGGLGLLEELLKPASKANDGTSKK
jgi:DNA-binding GntR family transcriptional regulator